MSLRLHLLGTPTVEKDGQHLELSTSKGIALLAYLTVNGGSIARERILTLLWPNSSGESGRKNLRNTLWTIHRASSDELITASGDRLLLQQSVWSDIAQLERLNADSSIDAHPLLDDLANGVLLEGFFLSGAPDFEVWLTGERERLGQMFLRVIIRQLEKARDAFDWLTVISLSHRALAYDRLQEPIHCYLMEAYAHNGQRADALRQYEQLRHVLSEELGVEPLPESTNLRDKIQAGLVEADLQSSANQAQPVKRRRRQPIMGGVPRVPYIGRILERAELDNAYRSAQAGEARVALITGEMGIGKTRLWNEWSTSLPQDWVVLETCGLESTRTLPFAPLIELIGSNACLRRIANSPLAIPAIWLAEVARVVPALRAAIPGLTVPAPLPFEEERKHLFEAFAQFLSTTNTGPLVLFMDDLHWVDQATLDWLGYFVQRQREQGLLLVLAYRPEEAPTEVTRLVAGWSRGGVLQRITLNRFTDDEAKLLVQSIGGDPAIAEHAVSQSAGNPYFLIELCRSGDTDVPRELSQLIRSRLNRLPDSTRQVLQAAGILEPEFDFGTLRRVSGRGEEETLDALDALLDAGVVVERSGRYAFAHPLVAEVVRDGLSNARSAFLHRRAAESIESTHSGLLPDVAATLMSHYIAANEPLRAAHFADMAAKHALDLAAPVEAIEFSRQALALSPTPERHINRAHALQRMNEVAAARAEYVSALDGFLAQGDKSSAGRTCLDLAQLNLTNGRDEQVLDWVNKGLDYLDVNADPALHSLAHFLLAAGMYRGGAAFADAEGHLRESFDIANNHSLPELASRSRFEMGNLMAQKGKLAEAIAAYEDAIRLAEQAGDNTLLILAHNNLAYHSILTGSMGLAHGHIESALRIAEATAIQMPRQYLYSTRGEIALAEQHYDDAETWFQRGKSEAEKAGNTLQAAGYQANLGLVAQGRGELDLALIQFEIARSSILNLQAPFLLTQIDLWLAELHLRRGERIAAEQTLRRIAERPEARQYQRLQTEAARLRSKLKSR